MAITDKTDTVEHNQKTELDKQKFLDALRLETTGANVLLACKIAGVNRTWMYQCKAEDDDFSMKWDRAIVDGKQSLHDMAYSVVYKSLAEGDKKMAMFVLRTLEPETWNRDRYSYEEIRTKKQETRCIVSPGYSAMIRRMVGNGKFDDGYSKQVWDKVQAGEASLT